MLSWNLPLAIEMLPTLLPLKFITSFVDPKLGPVWCRPVPWVCIWNGFLGLRNCPIQIFGNLYRRGKTYEKVEDSWKICIYIIACVLACDSFWWFGGPVSGCWVTWLVVIGFTLYVVLWHAGGAKRELLHYECTSYSSNIMAMKEYAIARLLLKVDLTLGLSSKHLEFVESKLFEMNQLQP